MNKINLFLFVSFLFIGLPTISHAQVQENIQSYDTMVNEGDFIFIVTPENPGPNELVTIKLDSDLVDSNRYPITWSVDGTVVDSGIGKRTIQVKTKSYGSVITVEMSIKLIESTVTKQIRLAPNDSTILWEASDAYVPPFYQGKKLPSREGLVRIVSIPNFLSSNVSTATKNAIYTWKRNGNAIPNSGGYGKDSILIKHNRIRESETIVVTSSSVDGGRRAQTSITIPFFDPKILFYKKDPQNGITGNRALSGLDLQSDKITLIAEPFFFSTVDDTPQFIKTTWKMNNKPLALTSKKSNEITLQKPSGSGTATISVSMENPSTLFQNTVSSIPISFSN